MHAEFLEYEMRYLFQERFMGVVCLLIPPHVYNESHKHVDFFSKINVTSTEVLNS